MKIVSIPFANGASWFLVVKEKARHSGDRGPVVQLDGYRWYPGKRSGYWGNRVYATVLAINYPTYKAPRCPRPSMPAVTEVEGWIEADREHKREQRLAVELAKVFAEGQRVSWDKGGQTLTGTVRWREGGQLIVFADPLHEGAEGGRWRLSPRRLTKLEAV